MEWWQIALIVIAVSVLGWLAQRFGIIDMSTKNAARRSGGLGGMLTSVDEVFAPTKHEAAIERSRQTSMPAPAPIPGDGDKGVYGGQKIVIDLTRSEPRRSG